MANLSISQLATAEQQSISDLFEVAIPDSESATGYVSRKVSMAQIADFIANDVQLTGLTTESQNIIDAINEVNETKVSWSEQSELGAKNFIKFPPYSNGYTYENNGIAFTVNSDGTITANGTNNTNNNAIFTMHSRLQSADVTNVIPNGEYIISGSPIGMSQSTFYVRVGITRNGAYTNIGNEYANNGKFVINGDDYTNTGAYVSEAIVIAPGATVNNLLFKPMLRLADDTDDTYAPYAMTNRQLTTDKADISMLGTDESGRSTASQAYAQGDYFVKDGKMYKAKVAIAQGASFTVGTNCEETTIFAVLTALAQS